jgi:dolichyl-phosphate beta-glucosyltransferase
MRPMTVIIPCYNEGARIIVDDYLAILATEPIQIIFVNDGSTDNTVTVLEGIKNEFPAQVSIYSLAMNSGKATRRCKK